MLFILRGPLSIGKGKTRRLVLSLLRNALLEFKKLYFDSDDPEIIAVFIFFIYISLVNVIYL